MYAMYIEVMDAECGRYSDWAIGESREDCYGQFTGIDFRTVVYETGCECESRQEAEDFINEERAH